jgi:hypothetical protein
MFNALHMNVDHSSEHPGEDLPAPAYIRRQRQYRAVLRIAYIARESATDPARITYLSVK